MTGRRERERKAASERVWTFTTYDYGPAHRFTMVDPPWTFTTPQPQPVDQPNDMLSKGYSPWTGKWFRDPPADEPFAVDVDGTIILHPSQYRVLNTNEGNEA